MKFFRYRPLWVVLGLMAPRPQHSSIEAEALARWARGRRSLVEIGVALGCSAVVLRKAMDPEGDLYLIDPFPLSRNPFFNTGLVAAKRTVGRVKNGRVHFIVGYSLEVAARWDRALDFVFIDADHRYEAVMADWKAWSRFVVPNGVVAFHDASGPQSSEGPALVVNELFRTGKRKDWKIVDEVDTLVVVQRID